MESCQREVLREGVEACPSAATRRSWIIRMSGIPKSTHAAKGPMRVLIAVTAPSVAPGLSAVKEGRECVVYWYSIQ
jgi:hypothetical protein